MYNDMDIHKFIFNTGEYFSSFPPLSSLKMLKRTKREKQIFPQITGLRKCKQFPPSFKGRVHWWQHNAKTNKQANRQTNKKLIGRRNRHLL